jgi:hypothetical protein
MKLKITYTKMFVSMENFSNEANMHDVSVKSTSL